MAIEPSSVSSHPHVSLPPSAGLAAYGWNAHWQSLLAGLALPTARPARVCSVARTQLTLTDGRSDLQAPMPTGAADPTALPQAGDWVAIDAPDPHGRCRVQAVLPRSSCIRRRAAGKVPVDQVIACNVDTVLVVMGLDLDFNLRRLERYRVVLAGSGARCVVVLSKADLATDQAGAVAAVQEVNGDAPVIACSVRTGEGLAALRSCCVRGTTLALIGSSGAGKSSLINALLGEDRQHIQDVRAGDGRGRHTTTARTLFTHPAGWCVLDTPGMRELRLPAEDAQVQEAFADVETLARACHFRDCTHDGEPGCAVAAAIEAGTLSPARATHYEQLRREARAARRRVARPPRQLPRTERRAQDRRRWEEDVEEG